MMTDQNDRQLQAASDRAERGRLDAELADALRSGNVLFVDGPRPGFAARRRNRMLTPSSTREA